MTDHRRIPPSVLEQAQRRVRGKGGDLTPNERANTLRELGHHAAAKRALRAQSLKPTEAQQEAEKAFAEKWGRYRAETLRGGLLLLIALADDVECRRVVYDLDGQAVAEHPR